MNPSDNWETAVTAEDQAYYQQLYQYEGANKSQNDLTPFLRRAQKVSTQQLNQILGAAFQANTTNMDDIKKSFYIALKLIACAQNDIDPSSPILSTSTPLPIFEDHEIIISKDRQKYLRIFQASGPIDGVITGDKAMKILMRSKLPVSTLSQIWNLADTDRQGKLDSTGFVIAMHYVAKCMNGNKTSLPHANAPDSILISARGESPSLATMTTTKHTSSSPATDKPSLTSPPLPPPISATQSPVEATNEYVDIFSPLTQQQHWSIDNTELANYTDAFNKIDTQNKGYIEGSEAVGFFGHSKLPSSDLAGIWDLADTRNRGQLSQEEFAIAMHLIRRVLGGTSLPSTLPATLLSHVDTEKQKSLKNQANQLKQSIENEQHDITALQGSVQKQNSVVSDLQQQVDTLEQSLQQLIKQKSDLQTTLDNLKRSEDDKRHKIAQLEKEYNTTQTELASLKTAHQQRLSLVGISNSQLTSAQTLRDKSAEELALAQSGKFDSLIESPPKSNDAPPPPPPSSRHHRTQSLRNQQPSGSSNKRPPAPPPSKKKRAPVPSNLPPVSDSKVTTDSEKALAAAVSAGVTSVVASSVLTGLTNSPKSSIVLDNTPMNADHENVLGADNHMEEMPTSPTILANTSTDEKEQAKEGDTATPEPHNNEAPTPDEPATNGKFGTAPINKDGIEKDKDSPLNANTVDDTSATDHTPLETSLDSDDETTDYAKAMISENNAIENHINAKEEPFKDADIAITPKEAPTGITDSVNESAAKDTLDTDSDNDANVNEAVPSEVSDGKNTTTAAGPLTEIIENSINMADTNDTQQSTVAGENKNTSANESPDALDIDDVSKATETASKSTDTNNAKGAMDEPTTNSDNIVDEREQTIATASSAVEQPVTATMPDVKKAVDATSSGDRTSFDSGDAIPNGSPVVVEPVDSGNKQPLTEANRAFDDTHTESPEIHTATTTASGSLKGDDHDFEVVDNASASSSFMSASMGADDDGLDEFDAAFSETLPDAKMVMSSTTPTSGTTTAPSPSAPASGFHKQLFDGDDFDEAFDPKVFTPTKAAPQSDQQPDVSQQVDSSQPKNDPFAIHDSGRNDNSFADAFTPFAATSSQQDASINVPSAFGDSFTAPQPQTSMDPVTTSVQNQSVSANSIPAPEFTDLKNLVVSPEQVTDYESNPFDEPSFEHPPENKDQQDMNLLDNDRPVTNRSSGQPQQLQEATIQQPIAPASTQPFIEQFTQTTQMPSQSIELGSMDSVQPNPRQLHSSPRHDDAQTNLRAPSTVSPSVSTVSNTQSDRQSQQSQQSQQPQQPQQRPAPAPATEGQAISSKGKHKGLFSLSSMLPKQKGKKSKSSKSSKKDKSGGGHDATMTQQPPPPQSPTTMQHYQDPSLENTLPSMSDQEVMANLRDFGNDSESMTTLTNMGFTADQAKEALQRYDYDLQKATNFLLDQ